MTCFARTLGQCMLAVSLILGVAASPAQAAYPERPITMLVPFAAGGPTDVIARIVAQSMSKSLGQQIIIENVTGAGGTTGTSRVAKATPDGYTIMMGHMGTHGAAPAVYPNLDYDPQKDFAPIGLAAGTPIIIVARKDFPAKDLKDFVEYVRKNADKLNEAHAGVGSVSFTTCSLFNALLKVKPTRVAYRGTGPALNDLVAGQVDYMCDQIVNLVPQIEAKTIRAYGIATEKRSPSLPDVPTTKEGGFAEYQVSAWNAVFAPAKTPPAILKTLSDAFLKAMKDENARKRLLDLGGDLSNEAALTPDGLRKLVASEVTRWNQVLKETGTAKK